MSAVAGAVVVAAVTVVGGTAAPAVSTVGGAVGGAVTAVGAAVTIGGAVSATLDDGAIVATGPTRAGSLAAGGVDGAVDGGVADVAAPVQGPRRGRRARRDPPVASGGNEDGREHDRRGGQDGNAHRDREPPAATPPKLSEEGLAQCRWHDVGRDRCRNRGQPGRRRRHPGVLRIGGRGELLAKLDQRRAAGGFWIEGAPDV